MLDNLGRIICRDCKASMTYRTRVDGEGAAFVFYCDKCGHGDIFKIQTAYVSQKPDRPPPGSLDLTMPGA